MISASAGTILVNVDGRAGGRVTDANPIYKEYRYAALNDREAPEQRTYKRGQALKKRRAVCAAGMG